MKLPMYGPVAPFTGAWIEIGLVTVMVRGDVGSHPLRVRGLKLLFG